MSRKKGSTPFLIESLTHNLFNWYWFKHDTISKGMFHPFFDYCCCVCFLDTLNMTFHIICKLRNFGLAFKNLLADMHIHHKYFLSSYLILIPSVLLLNINKSPASSLAFMNEYGDTKNFRYSYAVIGTQ